MITFFALVSAVNVRIIHIRAVLICAVFSLASVGLHAQSWWPFGGARVTGSGNIISGERDIAGFSGVALAGGGKVFISQGEQYKVRVEVDDNVMDFVKTDLKGDVLHIGLNNGSYNNVHLKVYITTPRLTSLSIAGSGDIVAQTPVNTTSLTSTISGSGSIKLSNGKAVSHKVRISGSGDVSASDIEAESAEVHISGSGDCSLNVAKNLDAHISGSGSVVYRGSPAVSKRISGSGSVRQR
jgi:hypothetical protein